MRSSEASLELRCYREGNKKILLKAFIRTGWYCYSTAVFNDFFLKILNLLIDVFTEIEGTLLTFSQESENRISSPEGTELWHRWPPWCLAPPRQYSFYSSRPSTRTPRQPVLVAKTAAVTDVELIIKPPRASERCYTEIQNSFAWTNWL